MTLSPSTDESKLYIKGTVVRADCVVPCTVYHKEIKLQNKYIMLHTSILKTLLTRVDFPELTRPITPTVV